MTNFFEKLLNLLRRDERFFSKDGKFLRNAVYEAAMSLDEKLLKILLADETARKNFFAEVDGIKIFDKIKFAWTINNRQFLPDSYTRFKNKIGLVDERGDFISTSGKVELVFPYKDCVLEGGQTKDDQKRDEIFYNETLAPDEIDRLLFPKVLVNAKRFSADGVQVAENFSETDNLIIKGNNLLAVASLLKKFENRVKCIYIDVPYNTGSDSFGYNDKFNHSTWLTFMKNRLDLARKLLQKDGSIWISIDDHEQAYLKVLCDEIFGQENFCADILWNSTKSVTNTALISMAHTHNLVYFKDMTYYIKNRNEFRLPEDESGFSNPDNDSRGAWKADPFQVGGWRPNQQYDIVNPKTGKIYRPNPGCSWKNDYEHFQKLLADNRIVFGKTGDSGPQRKRFLTEAVERGKVAKTWWDDCGTTTEATRELQNLFESRNIFATPKPERLIERILTLATAEGDLVLDNFLGSGTTAAVAHKMKRRYIGVEQMDYIETVTVERLKKVIEGEQGGISKNYGWQGGGSFVYCELAKLNQNFVEEIEAAEDSETLKKIYEKIIATGFISHKIFPSEIDENISEFEELSLEDRKKFLLAILDKNLLYVNYCDIDDEEFKISDADKKFSRSFYGV